MLGSATNEGQRATACVDATHEVTDISRIVQGQAASGRARQLLAATGSVPAPWWLAQYGVKYSQGQARGGGDIRVKVVQGGEHAIVSLRTGLNNDECR
jgi:hypothetical protein